MIILRVILVSVLTLMRCSSLVHVQETRKSLADIFHSLIVSLLVPLMSLHHGDDIEGVTNHSFSWPNPAARF